MYELNVWNNDSLDIPSTISGATFHSLINLCFQNADIFSLSVAPWTCSVICDLQKNLEPFQKKQIITPTWFGYDYTLAPPEDYREKIIYLYSAEPEAQRILLSSFDDIFLRKFVDGNLQDNHQTLEDLCFFSKGQLIVGTVSHENLLVISPLNWKFEDFLLENGNWNYVDRSPFGISVELGN